MQVNKNHLGYLDGVRGLAALYVVLFHDVAISYEHHMAPPFLMPFMLGSLAVAVFIVLSGFCLMLPVARTTDLNLPGGLLNFFQRRARRIIPPYYAALVVALILPSLLTVIKTHHRPPHWLVPGSYAWGNYGGHPDLLAHLLLIHNLWRPFNRSILGVTWSVATEWQIYFLFALLLLPVLRRWGTGAVLLVSLVVSFVPSYLLRNSTNLALACPWYVILFTIGMIGALQASRPRASERWGRDLCAQIALPCLLLLLLPDAVMCPSWSHWWRVDVIYALVAIWLILAGFHQVPESCGRALRRLLELRPVLWLGRISYSLYLTHYLTLTLFMRSTARMHHLMPSLQSVLNLAVVTPLALVCAWAFYLVFERPFLNKPVAFAHHATTESAENTPMPA